MCSAAGCLPRCGLGARDPFLELICSPATSRPLEPLFSDIAMWSSPGLPCLCRIDLFTGLAVVRQRLCTSYTAGGGFRLRIIHRWHSVML